MKSVLLPTILNYCRAPDGETRTSSDDKGRDSVSVLADHCESTSTAGTGAGRRDASRRCYSPTRRSRSKATSPSSHRGSCSENDGCKILSKFRDFGINPQCEFSRWRLEGDPHAPDVTGRVSTPLDRPCGPGWVTVTMQHSIVFPPVLSSNAHS